MTAYGVKLCRACDVCACIERAGENDPGDQYADIVSNSGQSSELGNLGVAATRQAKHGIREYLPVNSR